MHGSDAPKTAAQEIQFFFSNSDLVRIAFFSIDHLSIGVAVFSNHIDCAHVLKYY